MVVWCPETRILNALSLQGHEVLDIALTCLVLVAGSDRIGDFLKGEGGGSERSSKPIEIAGRVQIVETESAGR